MQRGDPVDRVAADGGQMRHPYALAAVLADERHPRRPVLVTGELCPHLLEDSGVDLVDDLHMARQRLGEDLQRPGFQRLGQQGVVGVAEGGHRDRPCLVPAEMVFVHQ